MANDNNLLLIILIGVVIFWIFNINTSGKKLINLNSEKRLSKKKEKFSELDHLTNPQTNFQSNFQSNMNPNDQIYENYRADTNEKNKTSSPMLNQVSDMDLINKVYAQQRNSRSRESSIEKMQPTGQQLIKTPPVVNLQTTKADPSYTAMAQQYVPNTKQQMYAERGLLGNPTGKLNDLQSTDAGYLLLPKNNIPEEKFTKVMPKDSKKALTTGDLLPKDENKDWFQVPNSKFNLMEAINLEIPEIKIGVDTVGQSRKNATYDLRAAPPCPKFVVSPWSNSTIEPDYNTKPLC